MRRCAHREAGVTIVEAAFVIPLLFMFIFGLVDLGMWTLNSNQASNAARDGARAGILAYPVRPVPDPYLTDAQELALAKNEARDAVVAAIQANLPEGTVTNGQVAIECFDEAGSSLACESLSPKPERVKVDVLWDWTLVTPVASILGINEGAVEGSATMEIVGRPVPGNGGVDPDTPDPLKPDPDPTAPCTLSALAVTPSTVGTIGNQLAEPLTITFRYDSGDCSHLQIVLTGTKSAVGERITYYCGCGDPPDDTGDPPLHVWEYAGSNNIWTKSTRKGVVEVFNGDDHTQTPLVRAEFTVQ